MKEHRRPALTLTIEPDAPITVRFETGSVEDELRLRGALIGRDRPAELLDALELALAHLDEREDEERRRPALDDDLGRLLRFGGRRR